MGRLLIILGVFEIFLGVGAMIVVFSIDAIPFVEDFLIDQYCESHERKITSARTYSGGSNSSSTVWYCEDVEGNRREITDKIGLTGVAVFLVPFLSGMVMIFMGAFRAKNNMLKRFGLAGGNPYGSSTSIDLTNASPAQVHQFLQALAARNQGGSATLASRLQQLDQARNQGLITESEYQRVRQQILDSMDDNL